MYLDCNIAPLRPIYNYLPSMGHSESKQHFPETNKIKFDLMCQNTYYHSQLQRDRKIADLQKKEQSLKQLILANKNGGNKESISMEASNCIGLLNYIKGTNNVLNQIKMLNENSLDIVNHLNRKQSMNIQQLLPHIHTVIWSTSRLNLTQIKEFADFISTYMGKNIYVEAENSPLVDLSLKKLFTSITASPLEIQDYLENFCKRNEIAQDLISGMWDQAFPAPNNNYGGGFGQQNFVQPPMPGFPQVNPYNQQPTTPGFTGQQGLQIPPGFENSMGFQTNPLTAGTAAQANVVFGSQTPATAGFGCTLPQARLGPTGSDLNTRLQELKRIGA